MPWGQKVLYKFIVDGRWVVHEKQPVEPDRAGNINNVYLAPPKPTGPLLESPPAVVDQPVDTKPTPVLSSREVPNSEAVGGSATDSNSTTGSTFVKAVSSIVDTVSARNGTSSTLGYVASGIGAAVYSVVGIDPVNAQQVLTFTNHD